MTCLSEIDKRKSLTHHLLVLTALKMNLWNFHDDRVNWVLNLYLKSEPRETFPATKDRGQSCFTRSLIQKSNLN